MAKTPKDQEAKGKLRFKVDFDGRPDEALNLMLYAFDQSGSLKAAAPVSDNYAELFVSEDDSPGLQLVVAPAPDFLPADRAISFESLKKLNAYEPVWQYLPDRREYELLPIPDFHWKYWFLCRCRVRGRVVKPVAIHGVTHQFPVCRARVRICEVDRLRYVIPTLPDDIIVRLRDELLELIERPRPVPIPDPPPFQFDPTIRDFNPVRIAEMNRVEPTILQAPETTFLAASATDGLTSLKTSMPFALQNALQSNAVPLLRQTLLENYTLILPYLCYWPWFWPYYCRCDEVAVVYTDHNGNFDTSIWYSCLGDRPDLYFWVEYFIGGVWTTVYLPYSICCHTYWNYACGTQATIRVTDPRVPWCRQRPPLPGKQVAVLSVGNNVGMTEIQRHAAGSSEGQTTDSGLNAPFGGSLEPHVYFGTGLIPSGITHYRWSYRRLGSTGAWTQIDEKVIRHYAEENTDSTLSFKPYLLGPDPGYPGSNLFKIQPASPPSPGPGVARTNWAPEVDARENTASAFFRTHLLEGGNARAAAGKYELKLELFDTSGPTPTVVDFTSESVLLKVPTMPAPFGPSTVPTEDVAHFPAQLTDMEDRVIRNAAGHIVAFRLVLHVDNNPCYGAIEDTFVDGRRVNNCGFVTYAPLDSARIAFVARHPNDFARFTFNVNKVSCGLVSEASASGWAGSASVNGFMQSAGNRFTKDIPVTTLLNGGSCGSMCEKAAFSETLYLWALATDGWNRLSYLDFNAGSKAFALEPLVVTP